jgi:hypothetical protein
MALSNYEMEIIRRKSEQEPTVIERLFATKSEAAKEYGKFLIKNNNILPKNLVKIIASSPDNERSDDLVRIVSMLKLKGGAIPSELLSIVANNETQSYNYASSVLSEDPEAEIEPEIFKTIMRDERRAHSFVVNVLSETPQAQLPEEMVALLKNNPRSSYNIVVKQLQNRIKKYEELDKNMIEAIAQDSNLASKFAHFVQPYVDETPQEILKNIQDPKTIRAKWHTGVTVKESFNEFFKARN